MNFSVHIDPEKQKKDIYIHVSLFTLRNTVVLIFENALFDIFIKMKRFLLNFITCCLYMCCRTMKLESFYVYITHKKVIYF
jgi:hypothetical protein